MLSDGEAADATQLLVIYDGTGPAPHVTIQSPDGEIELRGAGEIELVLEALGPGLRLAQAFGPAIPVSVWRQGRCAH